MSKKYPLLFKAFLIKEGNLFVGVCLDHYVADQGVTPKEAKENLAVSMWLNDNYVLEDGTILSLDRIEPYPYDPENPRYGEFIEYFSVDLNTVDLKIDKK